MAAGDFKNGANLDAFLVGGQLAATGDTTVHTVASNTREKLATFSISNVTANTVTVSIGLLPAGSSVDGTHKVVNAYALAAGDVICQEDVLAMLKGVMLPAGSSIVINAGTAAALNWALSGSVSS